MANFLCRGILTGSMKGCYRTFVASHVLRAGSLTCQIKQKHDSSNNKILDIQVDPDRMEEIRKSPSGWVPPSDKKPDLPFSIKRSRMNNLSVYTDYKGGGTRHITVVRKIKGDLRALERLLHEKLDKDLVIQINELTGQVKIKGNHKDKVVTLLKELGF